MSLKISNVSALQTQDLGFVTLVFLFYLKAALEQQLAFWRREFSSAEALVKTRLQRAAAGFSISAQAPGKRWSLYLKPPPSRPTQCLLTSSTWRVGLLVSRLLPSTLFKRTLPKLGGLPFPLCLHPVMVAVLLPIQETQLIRRDTS